MPCLSLPGLLAAVLLPLRDAGTTIQHESGDASSHSPLNDPAQSPGPHIDLKVLAGERTAQYHKADSSDCLAEYNNAVAAKSMTAFCDRCQNEKGASPLRDRCSLCSLNCWQVPHDATCVLNGVESVGSLTDSMLYLWAAAERCEGKDHNAVKCSVDVSSAISAVNRMINFILKAVQSCGSALKGANANCGIAVSQVTASLAGISAKSSGIVEHCPNEHKPFSEGTPSQEKRLTDHSHKFANCIIDIKSLVKSVLKASMRLLPLKESCSSGFKGGMKGDCAQNALHVVAAFASLGEFIAGSVGHCSKPANGDAACASEVLGLVRELHDLGLAGQRMSSKCFSYPEPFQLYDSDPEGATPSGTYLNFFMNVGLIAFIPVTARLSWVVGRWMHTSRAEATSKRSLSRSGEAQEMLGVND